MIVSLENAVERLTQGDVVALPTETVYGLGACIDQPEALKRIFEIKGRPFFDPLIVHVKATTAARSLVLSWPPLADFLAERFWPGPLTLVLPKSEKVSSVITSGLNTVAIRWPNHVVLQKILDQLPTPIAAPSANLFGKTSPTTAAHVEQEFEKQIPVVDGGPCNIGLESTVIAFPGPNEVTILRPGGVSKTELAAALKYAFPQVTITEQQSVASPGHLKEHYRPAIPLVLVHAREIPKDQELECIARELDRKGRPVELKLSMDALLAARSLYGDLRRLSSLDSGFIIFCTEPYFNLPNWEAIKDRLTRAATLQWPRS